MQKKKSEFLEAISREGVTDTNLAQHRLQMKTQPCMASGIFLEVMRRADNKENCYFN